MLKNLAFLIVVIVSAYGCSTLPYYRAQTSGQIGCPENEIEMTEPQKSISKTWTAKCRGKTYYCSSTSGLSFGSNESISCKESVK